MIWLYVLFSVLCSTTLFVLFKLFTTHGVNTQKAIVTNYLVAGLFGIILFNSPMAVLDIPAKSWFWMSCVLGFLFISLFYLMATIAQKISVSTASVASKMSVVIPVLAAIWLYGDSVSMLKIFGISLALTGLYLTTDKSEKGNIEKGLFWLPVILFFGSGLLDTLLKLAENRVVPPSDQLLFIPSIFLCAFVIGLVITGLKAVTTNTFKVEIRSAVGGILLGVVNFASIYFIWNALSQPAAESSVIFPIANMGVVTASAFTGLLIFKEQFTYKNRAGLALCIAAIAIIAFS